MKIQSILTSALLGLALAAGASTAIAKEMYRWTDENGTVHFTDQKPSGVQNFQTVVVPDAAPAATPAAPAVPAEPQQPSVAQQRREEIARSKREAREAGAQRDAQCAAWRAEVERLEPNRRVFFTNEQGETERMDDVERVNRVAELKARIAADCD